MTFGNCRRFQLRTWEEPWIATGTIGAPLSSASRPIPRRGFGRELAGARAAALGVHGHRAAAVEDASPR